MFLGLLRKREKRTKQVLQRMKNAFPLLDLHRKCVKGVRARKEGYRDGGWVPSPCLQKKSLRLIPLRYVLSPATRFWGCPQHLSSATGAAGSSTSNSKETLSAPAISIHPSPAGIQFVKRKSRLHCVLVLWTSSYVVRQEPAQDAEGSTCLVFLHCPGQPGETGAARSSIPGHWLQTQGEPSNPEAVRTQCPQIMTVCVLVRSAALSLFGNEPWRHPLETTERQNSRV